MQFRTSCSCKHLVHGQLLLSRPQPGAVALQGLLGHLSLGLCCSSSLAPDLQVDDDGFLKQLDEAGTGATICVTKSLCRIVLPFTLTSVVALQLSSGNNFGAGQCSERTLTRHSAAASACSVVRRASSPSRVAASERAALSSAASSANAAPLASCSAAQALQSSPHSTYVRPVLGWPTAMPERQQLMATLTPPCALEAAEVHTLASLHAREEVAKLNAAPGGPGPAAGQPRDQLPPQRGRWPPAGPTRHSATPPCPATAAPPLSAIRNTRHSHAPAR